MTFSFVELPPPSFKMKEPGEKLPFHDATWAAWAGVSEDDYRHYQIAAYGEQQPWLYRLAWRRLLRAENVTVISCDRLLQATANPAYRQAMTVFLCTPVRRLKTKPSTAYRCNLSPGKLKILGISLGLDATGLWKALGMPPLEVLHLLTTVYAAPLSVRLAHRANADKRWVMLLRKRAENLYGRVWNGQLMLSPIAATIARHTPLDYRSCMLSLSPSQSRSQMWTGERIEAVCEALSWQLHEVAGLLDVPVEIPVTYSDMPKLAPLEVGEIPPMEKGKRPIGVAWAPPTSLVAYMESGIIDRS